VSRAGTSEVALGAASRRDRRCTGWPSGTLDFGGLYLFVDVFYLWPSRVDALTLAASSETVAPDHK
jgi:hypothetical protein